MIIDELKIIDTAKATELLNEHGSVKKSIEAYLSK
jgi:hypothetical protein